ncbi:MULTISPECIES: MFS transporter [Pseudonocardia]|uniref:Multidrug resistance protein 3 n=2 Tax=Pseudonocardia TaxID=1847 RepID=A0A1Y2MMN9_PSEAH|nr:MULTISPECIES: MFS transporter [Pseudonocardia]OSY36524.1 Multidrug resistance protein 3 [Pseudonocardia autotrophica]TDN76296.1 MFS transporter [Pseudonocardia autotrophica]BBG00279.1 MFS transporter [Pseudonocardia autotrophica]
MVAIAVLASCGVLVSLLQTMVVPLLPRFPELLSVSPSTASWLITANLVAGAVSAPVLGRLGDMFGKRRMLLVALGLVGTGSLLGALAPGIELLLVARVLQGAAFGVIALGMSLMRDILPADRVGFGVGLMSSSLGFGGAIGLPITGVVAQFASWRWLFAGAAVLAVLQLVLVRRLVAESGRRTGGRFDGLGAIGIGAVLLAVLLAVSKGNEWGWTSPQVLVLIIAALVLAPAVGWYELRSPAPLIDLRVSARPAVLLTNTATVLVGFSMFAGFVLTTQLLQAPVSTGYGFGQSLLVAGLVLLPMGGSMVLFSSASARLSRARGPRTTLVLGTLLLGVGNLAFATLPGTVWLLMLVSTLTAIGAALAYSAIPLLIMRAVPESETAAANSLNTLARQLGTSACTAFATAVTTAFVIGDGILPAGLAYTIAFAGAGAAGLLAMLLVAVTPAPAPEPAPATTASTTPTRAASTAPTTTPAATAEPATCRR